MEKSSIKQSSDCNFEIAVVHKGTARGNYTKQRKT
jgi:hypothetical protein